MSGRGRQQGRGGRGGRSNHQFSSKKYKSAPKKTLSDYQYYLGSAKQASDYEKTTEFLINHIKKTFTFGSDIATALEKLEEFDVSPYKPSLYISTRTVAAEKAAQDKQFEIEFKAEYDAFMKRKQALETNMSKAYAFLWDQCSKGMQNKVEARSDFVSDIKDNPIELLKAIKQHALNYQEHRYEMSIIADAMRTLFSTKQREQESLQDYTKRFKTANDVLLSHIGGPINLDKYVESMPGYTDSNPDLVERYKEKAYKQLLAFIYLENSDRTKYGSLIQGLQTQQSLGNNQYPKTITEANNVLSEHKFDTAQQPRKSKTNKNEDKEEPLALSFAQMEGRCYCCGKKGHKSPQCRESKNKPKEEWAINKAKAQETQEQSHANVDTSNSNQSTTSQTDSTSAATSSVPDTDNTNQQVGWSGAHLAMQFYQASDLRNMILLDSESSTSIFCNPSFVKNIHTSNETLELLTN